MRRPMGPIYALAAVLALRPARAGQEAPSEDWLFARAAQLNRGASPRPADSLQAFQRFVAEARSGPRVAEAQFSIGELQFDAGLQALGGDPAFAKNPSTARLPRAAAERFAAANDAYQRALRGAASDVFRSTIHLRLGELAYDQRDWAAATAHFSAVTGLRRRTYARPLALIGLACTAAAHRDFERASRALAEIGRDDPAYLKEPLVSFLEGVAALHQSRFAEAERFLKPLSSPQARFLLGKTYLMWDKPLLAAGVFNQLYGTAPPSLREPARFFIGDAFFLSKDYEGATEKYAAFLSQFPSSRFKLAALFRVGSSYFQKGAYDEARKAFAPLAKSGDSYYSRLARYFVAESYFAAGRYSDALSSFRALAGERSDRDFAAVSDTALYKAAWTQKTMGDYKGAAKTFERFLRLHPQSPLRANVYLILGGMLLESKNTKGAVENYERVLDVAPKSPAAEQALFLMLKLQYDQQNYGFIVTSYQYLLKQFPTAPSKWKTLSALIVADTYLRLNRARQAREIYESILASDSTGAAHIYALDGIAWCDQILGQGRQAVIDRQKMMTLIQIGASSSTLANLNDLGLADSFYGQKDYADAYEFYAKFAKEHADLPAAAAALFRAGESLYHQKYYSQALETWAKLVSSMPSSPEAEKAWYRIADTLFRSEKFAKAQAAYQKIRAKDPEATFVLLRLAQCAYSLKNGAEALSLAKELLVRHPDAPEVNDALDLIEVASQEAGKGGFKEFIGVVVAANPGSPAAAQAQFRLARHLYDAKKYPEAAAEFERFSVNYANDALFPDAQLYLGDSYFLAQDFAKAAPVLQRYVESYPTSAQAPLALFHLGSSYYSLKQYDQVGPPYERLIHDYPDSPYAASARFNLALSYQEAGDLDHARAAYEDYLRTSRDRDQVFSALWSLFDLDRKKGAYDQALATLAKIEASARGRADGLEAVYRAGELRKTIGDLKGARRSWERLAAMKPAANPFRLQALIELSKIYEKGQEYPQAISIYKDLARNGKDPALVQAARERLQQLEGKR